MSKDLMREQFEAYARTKNIDVSVVIMYACHPPRFARYAVREVQEKWEIWQASREAVVVELEEHYCYDSPGDAYEVLQDCKKAIEAQGLKVAP